MPLVYGQQYWIDELVKLVTQQALKAGDNVQFTYNEDGTLSISTSGTGGTIIIQSEGIALPAPRPILDFAGAGVMVTDDPTNDRAVITIPGGGSTGAPAMTYHKVSAASNNAAAVKSAAGTVYNWTVFNNSPGYYPIFVKLYDKASAPNPALDTPLRTIGVQAGVSVNGPAYDGGLEFQNGIAIAIVKGMADNDNTPVAADDCVVDLSYL